MPIDLKFDKTFYFPSQAVEGSILLFCDTPTFIKSLKLRFYKKIKISLKNIDGTISFIENKEMITNEKFCLICENADLESGCNVFPFSFAIHSSEKQTGIAKCYFYDSMCVLERSFIVEGICETVTGNKLYIGKNDSINTEKTEKHLSVISKHYGTRYIDTVIKMSSFLCVYSKKLNFRIDFDKEWYSRGDIIDISLFPVNKIDLPVVASVSTNLYQVIIFNNQKTNIVKSKLISSYNAQPLNKNNFKLQFRIPMSMAPIISDVGFTVQCILVFHLNLFNGKQLKIKKMLNIGEAYFEIPQQGKILEELPKTFVKRNLDYKGI